MNINPTLHLGGMKHAKGVSTFTAESARSLIKGEKHVSHLGKKEKNARFIPLFDEIEHGQSISNQSKPLFATLDRRDDTNPTLASFVSTLVRLSLELVENPFCTGGLNHVIHSLGFHLSPLLSPCFSWKSQTAGFKGLLVDYHPYMLETVLYSTCYIFRYSPIFILSKGSSLSKRSSDDR